MNIYGETIEEEVQLRFMTWFESSIDFCRVVILWLSTGMGRSIGGLIDIDLRWQK